jgi:thiol-disulfide isomerase/thioredoxin
MSEQLWPRRKILGYLGLGAAGVGATLLLDNRPRPVESSGKVAPSMPPSSVSTLAAQPAAGKKLPELQGISHWLNSEPLSIAGLQGNVVLVQFWTFSCINCQRTLPYVVEWHERYAAKGLKIIGIHCPEFAYERDLKQVRRAVQKHKIRYPVAIDNEFKTWKAYENRYWPKLILADRQGIVRYDHVGEGNYDITESTIREFLG